MEDEVLHERPKITQTTKYRVTMNALAPEMELLWIQGQSHLK